MADSFTFIADSSPLILLSLGVATIGTLGTVLRARSAGLIPLARPLVEALRAQGLFLEDAIANAALSEIGE